MTLGVRVNRMQKMVSFHKCEDLGFNEEFADLSKILLSVWPYFCAFFNKCYEIGPISRPESKAPKV